MPDDIEEFEKLLADLGVASKPSEIFQAHNSCRSFLCQSLTSARADQDKIAREDERRKVIEKIKTARAWKLAPNTPRMIMIGDKELDDLLTALQD